MLSDRDISCECPALLSVYDGDERIAEQAILQSRSCLRGAGLEFLTNDLGDDSASTGDAHKAQMVAILEKLRVPFQIVTNNFAAIALDYEPTIRRLLLIEEAMEQETSAGSNGKTRTTKNSQGQRESIKLLYLDTDHRRALANTPFGNKCAEESSV